jgi:RNA polymerase sigma factor (sigma-70 family)
MKKTFKLGIQARLKHGALLAALERRGWSQAEAARFLDMNNGTFGRWINMQEVPKKLSDERAVKLYEITGESPEDLWPKEVFTPEFLASPRTFKRIRKVPVHILAMCGVIPALPAGPDDVVARSEIRDIVLGALNCLSQVQRDVLMARFFNDETQKDVALTQGLSPARISQIEHAALRRLRAHTPQLSRLRSLRKGFSL